MHKIILRGGCTRQASRVTVGWGWAAGLAAAIACAAPCAHAATYWCGKASDSEWRSDGNWSPAYPANDNIYIRPSRMGNVNEICKHLATVADSFWSGYHDLHMEAWSQGNPFVIQLADGRSWTVTNRLLIGDAGYASGTVFKGGAFNAASLEIGLGLTKSVWSIDDSSNCTRYARLEDTVMSLSGATAMTNGKLVLSEDATLVTKSVYAVTNFDNVLQFDGGTLRQTAYSERVLLPDSAGMHVLVGQRGGTIDTAGRVVCVLADISDVPGESGAMTFSGGGLVNLTGRVGWTGGTSIGPGTCLVVTNTAPKDALFAGGFAVGVTDDWLESDCDAELMKYSTASVQFSGFDLASIRLPTGAPAPVRLSADRRKIKLRKPNARVATMVGNGNLSTLFPSPTTADLLVVTNTAKSATLDVASRCDVLALRICVLANTTLTIENGDMLSAGRLQICGGGKVVFAGSVPRVGGLSVATGACIEIPGEEAKEALFGSGVIVLHQMLNSKDIVRWEAWHDFARLANGAFAEEDLRKVRFADGLRAPLCLAEKNGKIKLGATLRAKQVTSGTVPLSSLWNSDVISCFSAIGDKLKITVSGNATLDIDSRLDVFSVWFDVKSGCTLHLTGGELGAAFVRVDGGTVVAENGYVGAGGMKVADFGRLLGTGTVASVAGKSRCVFKDLTRFSGTLDAGNDGNSPWRVKIDGGACLEPSGHVSVLAGAEATVASAPHPFASGEGMTVKGQLKVLDGATFCAGESGNASGGMLSISPRARLKFRFSESGVSPCLQPGNETGSSIVK